VNQPTLALFDRQLTLAELLPAPGAECAAQALTEMLGAPVRILDLENRIVAGPAEVAEPVSRGTVPLTLQLDTVGFLEGPLPLARLAAAAALVEQSLQANARCCMAIDLHVEAVRGDYQRLQEEHAALLASEARYRELTDTLERRVQEQVQTIADSQRQLYQTEKLASVGQLAAGVAHEINNPVGFVRSNLNTARGYLRTISGLQAELGAGHAAAAAYWKREGLEELLRDFDDLLAECIGGADRVARIVADLKAFSSMDRDEEASVDLNESLRVVCSVARGQMPEGTRIELGLQPLPMLTCRVGRLNQVFLNLVLNGIQALGPGGRIRVTSTLVADEIRICVEDDGCGIPEEHLSRIFDPFFTTRAVGSGTGLGLTVSRDIVRAHGGVLDISSSVGVGTRAYVRLPLNPAPGSPK
jgi:signal transduction histidine kinase